MRKFIPKPSLNRFPLLVIYGLVGLFLGPFFQQSMSSMFIFLFAPIVLLAMIVFVFGVCRLNRDLLTNITGSLVFGFGSLFSSRVWWGYPFYEIEAPWSSIWWVIIFSGIPMMVSVIMCANYKRQPQPYTCRSCGYDLEKITSARCPECGEQNPFSQAVG